MKKKALMAFMGLATLSLASCGTSTKYAEHLDDYVFEMDYHSNFNVLQLTDIHWNTNTSGVASKAYLEKVIKEADRHIKDEQGSSAKIDLIEITGDTFMISRKMYVTSFIEEMESLAEQYGFHYTTAWGNHDRQGDYSPKWLADRFRNAKHCKYVEIENDNLTGRSNFVINLKDGENVKFQIANLDSGVSIQKSGVSFSRDYDYIRDDQVDWLELEHNKVGSSVPIVAYFHVPQYEMSAIFEEVMNDSTIKRKFFKLEGFAEAETKSKFFDFAKDNNVIGMFVGHAHAVDWTTTYKGITIGFGVKTGVELYYGSVDINSDDEDMKKGVESINAIENFDLVGASLVTLKDDSTFDLEHLYLNERVGGDFINWARY